MFYIYIIENKEKDFYTGFTNDLKRRFNEHNRNLYFATKNKGPWKLIYYEACLSEIDAKRREGYLKTTQGRRLLKHRLRNYLAKT